MNPIPLTSPDGLLRAWMCGVCESVHCGVELPWDPSERKRTEQADEYLSSAERCCICRACHRAQSADRFLGFCVQCAARERWRLFGLSWGWVGQAIADGYGANPDDCSRWARSEFA